MKKSLYRSIAILLAALLLTGCQNKTSEATPNLSVSSPTELGRIYEDIESHKGEMIRYEGQIYVLNNKNNGYNLYIFSDGGIGRPKASLVSYEGKQKLEEGSLVEVTGEILTETESDEGKVMVIEADEIKLR